MYYNPAATGSKEAFTASFLIRSHMTGFDGAPATQMFNLHAPLKNPKVALGLSVDHQSIGAVSTTSIFFNYAYRLELGANKLSFGIKAGINNGSQNNPELEDPNDITYSEQNRKFVLPNLGVGVMYYGEKYWASFSVPTLLGSQANGSGKYSVQVDSVNRDFVLAGGGSLAVNANIKIEPSLMLIYNPGYTFKYIINAVGVYQNAFKFGLGYRGTGALIITAGYNVNRQFGLAYSFDLNLGEFSELGSTSHEFCLLYMFGYKVNAASPRGF